MAFPSDLVRTKNWGSEVLTDSDLEGQYDLIINWVMAALNSTTGHNHDGSSNNGPEINITNLTVASQAQGDIIYASSASAWARLAKGTASQILAMNAGATAPEWVAGFTPSASNALAGSVVQVVNTQTGAVATGTTAIPYDDTIPQITEGTEFMTLAITPTSATNKLKIEVVFNAANSGAARHTVALFQDSTANALAAVNVVPPNAGNEFPACFTHYMTSGTTSATTFRVRCGTHSGDTITFNGSSGARKLGGVLASSITITEIKV
jgi:hypothetical protein